MRRWKVVPVRRCALYPIIEAEAFRHITWYLDRPDVLARFTHQNCRKANIRSCFPMATVLRRVNWRIVTGFSGKIVPETVLSVCALVAGDFDVLRVRTTRFRAWSH